MAESAGLRTILQISNNLEHDDELIELQWPSQSADVNPIKAPLGFGGTEDVK